MYWFVNLIFFMHFWNFIVFILRLVHLKFLKTHRKSQCVNLMSICIELMRLTLQSQSIGTSLARAPKTKLKRPGARVRAEAHGFENSFYPQSRTSYISSCLFERWLFMQSINVLFTWIVRNCMIRTWVYK